MISLIKRNILMIFFDNSDDSLNEQRILLENEIEILKRVSTLRETRLYGVSIRYYWCDHYWRDLLVQKLKKSVKKK